MSSVRKYGGTVACYMPIHQLMDSSKGAIADNRHRMLYHNSHFISQLGERIKFPNSGPEIDGKFPTIINSEGKEISVRSIMEDHINEDLGCIPTVQDYFEEMDIQDWMMGKGRPPSFRKLKQHIKSKQPKLTFLQKVKNYFNPKKQQTIKIDHD